MIQVARSGVDASREQLSPKFTFPMTNQTMDGARHNATAKTTTNPMMQAAGPFDDFVIAPVHKTIRTCFGFGNFDIQH